MSATTSLAAGWTLSTLPNQLKLPNWMSQLEYRATPPVQENPDLSSTQAKEDSGYWRSFQFVWAF